MMTPRFLSLNPASKHPTKTEWFKEHVMKIKSEVVSLKEVQTMLVKTLRNLKVCEYSSNCATDFKDVLQDLMEEEGSLKMLNDKFGANVEG